MKDSENITTRQSRLKKLTVGTLKKLLRHHTVKDTDEVFADFSGGWSGVFQVYHQDNRLFLLASDKDSDSGIGASINDWLLWESDGLDEEETTEKDTLENAENNN